MKAISPALPSQRLLPHVVSLIFLNVTPKSSLEYVYRTSLSTGSFSTDDGDGSENVIKHDSRFFKLSALISVHLKCQKYWANFPGVDFLGTALKFRKRKKNSSSLVYTSSITRKIMHFYVVVVQRRQRNVQLEKCGARANLLFFGRSRCCRRRYLSSRQTSTNGRSKRL